MSSFQCEKCRTIIEDSPVGYKTECEHYPLKRTAAQEPMPDTKGASQNTDSVTSGNERPSGGLSPNSPVAAAHTDHGTRHYDRTCPACKPAAAAEDKL